MDFALIYTWGSIFMWLISIFSRTQPKIGTNQALKGKYMVIYDNTEPTFVSKRQWVSHRPQISHFWGTANKNFGANAPTLSPQSLHQVSVNDLKTELFQLSYTQIQTLCY